MALKPHRIIEFLQNLGGSKLQTLQLEPMTAVTSEAVAPQLFTLTTGDGEDPSFRRITSPSTLRDLNPLMHDRMLQVCYFLAVTTPFGKRIVEILSDYIVGKGVRFTAEDPRVQEIVGKFWERNKITSLMREWCNELTIFGELCIPIISNPIDGSVQLGYVDPMNIDSIEFAAYSSNSDLVALTYPYAIHLRKEVGEAMAAPLLLVRTVDDPNDPDYGRLKGQCFYFAINKAKSASRGFSELFSLADWIDLFDQMIFDFADKIRFLNSFVWHYVLEGGDEKRINEFKNKLTQDPPKQGGVQVTNEKVKITAQTPDFKGADMAAGANMVELYGLGGAGLPGWFFANPVDANRSTAQEMAGPTGKKMVNRQNQLGEFISQVVDFVIDCAIQHGTLPEGVDRTYMLEFPEVEAKGATTLQGVSLSLQTGVDEGWIRNETAARAFHTVLSEVGIDIDDSSAEFKLAQEEKQDRTAAAQNTLFPQDNLALALQQNNRQDPPAGDGETNQLELQAGADE